MDVVLIIDGLDEAADRQRGDNPVAALIDTAMEVLPPFVRVIVKARPSPCFDTLFSSALRISLEPGNHTRQDVRMFLEQQLHESVGFGLAETQIGRAADFCQGNYVAARLHCQALEAGLQDGLDPLEEFDPLHNEQLPVLLSRLYLADFSHRYPERIRWQKLTPALAALLDRATPRKDLNSLISTVICIWSKRCAEPVIHRFRHFLAIRILDEAQAKMDKAQMLLEDLGAPQNQEEALAVGDV